MHKTNHLYGHADVLAAYCGLGYTPPLWGYLQHGWNEGTGFPTDQFLAPWLPRYVWTSSNLRCAAASGRGPVAAVGAPFLYLPNAEPCGSRSSRDYTLFFPFHGWAEEEALGDHLRQATEVRERELGALVVCLHPNEFKSVEIRRIYSSQDFEVVTNGAGTDPQFLVRQAGLLGGATRVVSNRVSTAIWYAAYMGCDVEIYGAPVGIFRTSEGVDARRRHAAAWPELFHDDKHQRQEAVRVYADENLGVEHRRAPDELGALLGWAAPRKRTRALSRVMRAGSAVAAPVRAKNRARRRRPGQ